MKKILLTFCVCVLGVHAFTQEAKEKNNFDADSTREKLMPPIEIRAVRAGEKYPFPKTLVNKRAIEKNNQGQDIPFLLNQVPGTLAHSDAGNGFGYTGLRIRGTDASRINFTLNGIAYNDAESQGVFLVNLPDFLSSVNSIQVQRGVGTSSNGTGAFGATVNMLTNEVQKETYGFIGNSMGSFDTRKHTFKAGTGLINNRFTLDVRLSYLNSDGYIERASSDLKSYYVSAASIKENSSLRLNIFSGKEKTYQAWYGVNEENLKSRRRFNEAGTEKPGDPYENETDNYTQTHYQLFYNKKITNSWNLNSAIFATTGKGYYEQYRADQRYSRYGLPNPLVNGIAVTRTDLIRQLWLDNIYYGSNFSFQYKDEKKEILLGGGASDYQGKHFGQIIWAANGGISKDQRWYDQFGSKQEQHAYAKWIQEWGKFSFFGDLQLRNVHYATDGFRDNPNLPVNRNWLFFNPKAGVRYTKGLHSTFASIAIANKEPNRDDFEAGGLQSPKHETLVDAEAGWERNAEKLKMGVTFYYMKYRNQLVLTGKINDVGAYTRSNIDNSYRAGLELEMNWKPVSWFGINQNVALSKNRIIEHTEYYDDYDAGGQKSIFFAKSVLAFSPSVMYNGTLVFNPFKRMELSLMTKYVSRQYLDNTARKDRSLDPYFVQDLQFNYQLLPKHIKNIELIATVYNIWNTRYTPNGYTYSYQYGGALIRNNYYFPMAERNFMIGVNLHF